MMTLNGKTVCVTGGAGFIGAALAYRCAKLGARVIVIDRNGVADAEVDLEVVQADIRDTENLRDAVSRSDVIFHLAAIDNRVLCQQDFPTAFDINTGGTARLLALCTNRQRVVFASSNMVYGESEYLPMDERHPLNCFEPYAVSKVASEYLFRSYNFLHKGLPYTIVRNFNTYGPKQSPRSLIPSLILEGLAKGKIEVWAPNTVRDLLYRDDCVDGFIKVAQSESTIGSVVNLGSGYGATLGEVAQIIGDALGVPWVDMKKPLPISGRLVADTRRLSALTGWRPQTSLGDGLLKTVEYYKQVGLHGDGAGQGAATVR